MIAVCALGVPPSAAAAVGGSVPRVLPGTDLVVDHVAVDRATGNLRLVRFTGPRPVPDGASRTAKAMNLLTEHAPVFGLVAPSRELRPVAENADPLGGGSASFRQVYLGLPVFGTQLRVHFDARGAVRSINGTVVSDIQIDPTPTISSVDAEARARRLVAKATGSTMADLGARSPVLLIYRTGLVRGVPGSNHLAWEVEVTSPTLREVLYLDAHDGRLLDRRSEIHEIDRVVHLRRFPNPVWSEGDALPYSSDDPAGDAEINELISATGDIHDLMANLTAGQYLSFDGEGAVMHSIYDSDSIDCPNAVESNGMTSYCDGMVSDDVVAHEWTHAYTEWTHRLIYQWQPGALNEAYSDIYGELADQLNGRGSDLPNQVRGPGECSTAGGNPTPTLEITDPAAIAGVYPAGGAVFNPIPPWSVSGSVVLVNDAVGVASDACQALQGFPVGAVALIDRGDCLFRDKVLHAQQAGASAAIVVNNQGNDVLEMGGDLPRLDIPSVFVGQADGTQIKVALDDGVSATMSSTSSLSTSLRWLIGEDTAALGTLRDMWSPSCLGDPGRVGSAAYACRETDNGGVHTNSGVVNHAFALLVDGGSYNGETVRAIGTTKAARIYWRAMSVYQTPVSNFANHADLLEIGCQDLIGATLYSLTTGAAVPETVTADDCVQVASAMRAVEMRDTPVQCNFEPLLDPDGLEPPGNVIVFDDGFDDGPEPGWRLSNYGVFPEYEPRDWVWTDQIPAGGDGGAWFAVDSVLIGDCVPGNDDQSGVMQLTSPLISVPIDVVDPVLAFDHWIATEHEWDGGNLKISVNGGPFLLVPISAFTFNPYNGRINPAGGVNPNTNPLAGETGFTGTNQGTLGGSWGRSLVELRTLVDPGDSFVLRFDLGVDGCNGAEGWYIDRVAVTATGLAPRHVAGRVAP